MFKKTLYVYTDNNETRVGRMQALLNGKIRWYIPLGCEGYGMNVSVLLKEYRITKLKYL